MKWQPLSALKLIFIKVQIFCKSKYFLCHLNMNECLLCKHKLFSCRPVSLFLDIVFVHYNISYIFLSYHF